MEYSSGYGMPCTGSGSYASMESTPSPQMSYKTTVSRESDNGSSIDDHLQKENNSGFISYSINGSKTLISTPTLGSYSNIANLLDKRDSFTYSLGGEPSYNVMSNLTGGTYEDNRSTYNQNNTTYIPGEVVPIFEPDNFVTSQTPLIDESQEIMEYVKEAFEKTTGEELPRDFTLQVCEEEELKQIHQSMNGTWNEGIKGFCINRKGEGISSIFVKNDELAKLMLTIGHELGHLQSTPLASKEEEAKAFAFSMEWMDKIRKHDIAGLSEALVKETPADNGLHNVAFNFVTKLMSQGKKALDIFKDLVNGSTVESSA